MKYDFFISYCREEISSMAYPLYRSLSRLGFNVWMDRDRIIPGRIIYETIDEAICASKGVIAIIAAPYLTRPWTIHELQLTLSLENGQKEILLPIYHNIAPEIVWDNFPALNGRAYEPFDSLHFNCISDDACLILDRLVHWYFQKAVHSQESDYKYQWLNKFADQPHITQLLILLEQCTIPQAELRTLLLGYTNAIRYTMAILSEFDTVGKDNKTFYIVASRYCTTINNQLFSFNRSLSNTMLLACKSILTFMCEQLEAVLDNVKDL